MSRAPDRAPLAVDRVRQHAERGRYDAATIYAILDAGLICHVSVTIDDRPRVIPMGYARDGDRILLHGAVGSRLLRELAAGRPCCLTVTHLDALVLARSPLHHSMNYRSVMVQGNCEEITEPEEKSRALDRIMDHLVPGRGDEVRPSTPAEIQATRVVALPIANASAKLRSGPPIDAAADVAPELWAGILPLTLAAGPPIASADTASDTPPPMSASISRARFPLLPSFGGDTVEPASDAIPPDWHQTVAEGLSRLPTADGQRFVERFRHGSLELELYAPRGHDPQTPHSRDEVYIVVTGHGRFRREDRTIPFGPGDFLFVPAGDDHRFLDFSDDLVVWVLFYGPEGGES